MVGIKRPYPFSLDNAPGPSINFKFPTFVAPPMRTDETTTCGNRGGTFNLEPGGNSIFRLAYLNPCNTFIAPVHAFLHGFHLPYFQRRPYMLYFDFRVQFDN